MKHGFGLLRYEETEAQQLLECPLQPQHQPHQPRPLQRHRKTPRLPRHGRTPGDVLLLFRRPLLSPT
jgi:hypothetical protein